MLMMIVKTPTVMIEDKIPLTSSAVNEVIGIGFLSKLLIFLVSTEFLNRLYTRLTVMVLSKSKIFLIILKKILKHTGLPHGKTKTGIIPNRPAKKQMIGR